jgi:hypothetical protein
MISLPEEKVLYSEIQKKLFYIIPEKWESIYLYTAIIDVPGGKPQGELYFYYVPKGIIKKKPVNCYEIPNLFDIDEEEYSELITELYKLMKSLRIAYAKRKGKVWSNANITIENCQFKAEFGFEDLKKSEYNSYERHVIWRYKYLKTDLELFSKKDKNIIQRYLNSLHLKGELKKDLYIEGVYKQPVKNIVDYERTLTVDEAIAQSKPEIKEKQKKHHRKEKELELLEEDTHVNNQILNFGNKPIKRD